MDEPNSNPPIPPEGTLVPTPPSIPPQPPVLPQTPPKLQPTKPKEWRPLQIAYLALAVGPVSSIVLANAGVQGAQVALLFYVPTVGLLLAGIVYHLQGNRHQGNKLLLAGLYAFLLPIAGVFIIFFVLYAVCAISGIH